MLKVSNVAICSVGMMRSFGRSNRLSRGFTVAVQARQTRIGQFFWLLIGRLGCVCLIILATRLIDQSQRSTNKTFNHMNLLLAANQTLLQDLEKSKTCLWFPMRTHTTKA